MKAHATTSALPIFNTGAKYNAAGILTAWEGMKFNGYSTSLSRLAKFHAVLRLRKALKVRVRVVQAMKADELTRFFAVYGSEKARVDKGRILYFRKFFTSFLFVNILALPIFSAPAPTTHHHSLLYRDCHRRTLFAWCMYLYCNDMVVPPPLRARCDVPTTA
jgi:hypothetical protein